MLDYAESRQRGGGTTRFKVLRRIEAAIEHRNERELLWAHEYCKTRLQLATMEAHKKHWLSLEKRVKSVLNGDVEREQRKVDEAQRRQAGVLGKLKGLVGGK